MKRASHQALTIAVPSNAKQARALLESLRAGGRDLSMKLRQLEAHPAYRRLRNTKCTGSTRRAWERASTLADELAVQLREYLKLLDHAAAAVPERGRVAKQDLARMTLILNGHWKPGDKEADASVPPSEPGAENRPEDRPENRLENQGVLFLRNAMNNAHAEVTRIVDDIEECAAIVRQRLHSLDGTLRGLRGQVGSLAFRDEASIAVLGGLERELIEITPAAHADPRGCVLASTDGASMGTPVRLRRLTAGVENAHMHLSTLSREQAEWQKALTELRVEFANMAQLQQERRKAESTVRVRVAGLVVKEEPDTLAGLHAALTELEQRRANQTWGQTRKAIDEIKSGLAEAREEATSRRDAAQSLLDQRDNLRGRLSAYRAMAIRLNHAEDLDLAAAYDRTHQLLWSGPCDLKVATAAVAEYQRAVIERTQADDTVYHRGSQQ